MIRETLIREIGKRKPLSPEREAALSFLARTGDTGAARELVVSNLGLVLFVARQYEGKGLASEELVSAGSLGLVEAAHHYDAARGRFSTCAVFWIRAAILEEFRRARLVALPHRMILELVALRAARRRLEQRFGREPEPWEMADECAIDVCRAEELLECEARHASLDAPLPDRDGLTLHDTLTSPGRGLSEEEREQLWRATAAMRRLPGREREIVGRTVLAGETLEETGNRYGITRERARQIRRGAFARMRRYIEARG